MTRHWKSVVLLLVPVMTYGWLVTSLFIWWMIPSLSWLESLACSACVTATDPVLASSVVGKGRFAKRIPKHLRDLLSAESGCNDGMAFPFIYLSLYLIRYRPHAASVFEHWFCLTILYECVLGGLYGLCVGYAGRHAIKFAARHKLIDRESFLVFYFVLALWCAGTGSMLGFDDLLVGFCAGVAFSNDGWFSQKTEESHVSNVIDLLLNLAFFVYFGAIIPWASYNRPDWGITPWRLVVISVFVILFRRIPIMVALKPVIPDIKTWREALFAGHFGPIGVGAVFVAIMARAELETGATTPLATLPAPGTSNHIIIELIWPITTFLILTSIVVHGSSIAVFTLGKHINTMRITMSYTTANEEPNWLSRLPLMSARPSMSIRKPDMDESSDEKLAYASAAAAAAAAAAPGSGLLSRQLTEEDNTPTLPSRPASLLARRRKNWDAGHGPGGPISDSAILPYRPTALDPLDTTTPTAGSRPEQQARSERNEKDSAPPAEEGVAARRELYQEGSNLVVENEEGDVIGKAKAPEAGRQHELHIDPLHVVHPHEHGGEMSAGVADEKTALAAAKAETLARHRTRRPAWAYRFDDNIVVEDEDGEVIRRYKLPKERKDRDPERRGSNALAEWTSRMLAPFRSGSVDGAPGSSTDAAAAAAAAAADDDGDDNSDAKTIYSVRGAAPQTHFRMHDEHGRRLSKHQFLQKLQQMDPHARAAMASMSTEVSSDDLVARLREQTGARDNSALPTVPNPPTLAPRPRLRPISRPISSPGSSPGPSPSKPSSRSPSGPASAAAVRAGQSDRDVETEAEKRRRLDALGILDRAESDSDEEEGDEGRLQAGALRRPRRIGIRFKDEHHRSGGPSALASPDIGAGDTASGIQWGEDVKGKGRE